MDKNEILERLREPDGVPKAELKEIAARRDEFVPVLIEAIRETTALGGNADLGDYLPWFSLYLLAQFRETEALQPILEYFALDEQTDDDLFGDILSEDGPRILAGVGKGQTEALRAYALRKGLSPWARSAALGALELHAAWGETTRESVENFFSELFRTNAFGEDQDGWTTLIWSCLSLNPTKYIGDIRDLFSRDLVALDLCESLEDIEHEVKENPESYSGFSNDRRDLMTDTAADVEWWAEFCVEDDEEAPGEPEKPGVPFVAPAKPGRNDLCPCGSGKKYKKCCGNA